MAKAPEKKTEPTEPLNVHQRIIAIMRSLSYVKKGGRNEFQKFNFVKHDDVTRSVREQLIEHGVLSIPTITESSCIEITQKNAPSYLTTITMQCAFVNIDNPEDKFSVSGIGQGIDRNDLGPGKATSYAFKNILLKTFALETGEADNEETADDKQPAPKRKPPIKKVDPTAPMNKAELTAEYPRIKDMLLAATGENQALEAYSICMDQINRMPDNRIEALQKQRDRFSDTQENVDQDTGEVFPGDIE
tara:strand:- start:9681 stop:10421 length:741 start_codon:yes stop_codon:yes gene_type:complete